MNWAEASSVTAGVLMALIIWATLRWVLSNPRSAWRGGLWLVAISVAIGSLVLPWLDLRSLGTVAMVGQSVVAGVLAMSCLIGLTAMDEVSLNTVVRTISGMAIIAVGGIYAFMAWRSGSFVLTGDWREIWSLWEVRPAP
jgi:hypothetical protein